MKKVFIGVGHGGADSGAIGSGFKEKSLTLSIALACCTELERHGVSVKMSRTKDEADAVMDEVRECNSYNPDLAADIHINAGGGDGAEVFYHVNGGTSRTLAINILDAIKGIGQNSRGAKVRKNSNGKDYYAFIRETKAPAVIVECAFIDNVKDIDIISTAEKQKKMGEAVAHGILHTLGLPLASAQKAIYRVQVGAYTSKDNAARMVQNLRRQGYDAIITTGKE